MAYIQAAGYIGSDLLRRETPEGVMAGFRLATGQPGRGQVWVDVEAWGHQAGVLHTHGRIGRAVLVAGRLAQHTWRERTTGQTRSRIVIQARDFDFLNQPDHTPIAVPNQVLLDGRVTETPTTRADGVISFTVTTGQAGAKTGRLQVPVHAWADRCPVAGDLRAGRRVVLEGRLAYRRTHGAGHHYLHLVTLHTTAPAASEPAAAPR